ncbi:MAG: hypothetical protein JO051_11485 [Acidobacteriaceae bacterium]|nr:hypothetical protein [Acidobacteriaceae bacterium]
MKRPYFALAAAVVLSAALIVLTAAYSTAQVRPPAIGIARLPDGSVRNLYGLPADVVVDSRSLGSFDAASFSDQAGLVAKGGRIQLVNTIFTALGEYGSDEAQPLLNVDGDARSAIAWLPSSQSILYWSGENFVVKAVSGLDASLKATSVRVAGRERAQLLMTNAQGAVLEATVGLESGNVISLKWLPGMRGEAFWQGSNLLFAGDGGIGVVSADGAVRALGAVTGGGVDFQHISSKWVLVTSRSDGRLWAVHFSGDEIGMSEVPAPRMVATGVAK